MPRWFYALVADIMVVVHLAFMLYIILGEFLIVAGAFARWAWVRKPWFRWTHLGAIMIVVVETFVGMTCPLTEWEYNLRDLAGQVNMDREASFTGRMAREILFVGCITLRSQPPKAGAFMSAHRTARLCASTRATTASRAGRRGGPTWHTAISQRPRSDDPSALK